MNKRIRIVLAAAAVAVLAALLGPAALAEAAEGETYVSNMYGTFWALIPPVVAIALALITKEAYSSLFIGIVVGALFYANFQPVMALDTLVNQGFIGSLADKWNAGIFLFLVILGILVALINQSGGSAALAVGRSETSKAASARCWPPLRWACSSLWMTTSIA